MDVTELAQANAALASAQKAEATFAKVRKPGPLVQQARNQNKETIAGLVILTYQHPPLPPVGPEPTTPLPPATYSIPAGATSVTNGATLTTQLATTPAKDIVCENGTYATTTYFINQNGHRIYARNLGQAIFTSGFTVIGTDNPVFRGLTFDVSSLSKVHENQFGIITNYGSCQGMQVLDCTFDGNDVIEFGIRIHGENCANGLIIERCFLQHFHWDAIRIVRITSSAATAENPVILPYQDPRGDIVQRLQDIDIDYVRHGTTVLNGTGESGIWLECQVAEPVNRIRLNRCYWMGVNTLGNAWDTTWTNLTVTGGGFYPTAVYLEHYNTNNHWDGFNISGCGSGFYGEWNDPQWGGNPAIYLPCSFKNGVIDGTGVPTNGGAYSTGSVGIYIDGGNPGVTAQNIQIKNMNWAGVGCHLTTSPLVHSNLTFTNIAGGRNYTGSHKSANPPTPGTLP